MVESLSSAELLRQLKSVGAERLLHVVNAFLRQSYVYPPLLTFGGKTSFVFLVDVYDMRLSSEFFVPSSNDLAVWIGAAPARSQRSVSGQPFSWFICVCCN